MKSTTFNLKSFLNKYTLEIILLIIFIALTIMSPGFLTPGNLLNILRNISLQGVIAFGMTMVIIAGEIDLSIGSTVGLTGVIIALTTGLLAKLGIPMNYGVLAGIALSIIAVSYTHLTLPTKRIV